MNVLVAGSTSVLGRVVVADLARRGHQVSAMSRSPRRAAALAADRVHPVVCDVTDGAAVEAAVARVRPDAVVSLLIALPRNGPSRYSHFRQSVRLWDDGVPNVLAAATRAKARVVSESVVFAYGYDDHGSEPLTEDAPLREPGTRAQRRVLGSLRRMERNVRASGGTVLRYGVFRGATVPSENYLASLLRRRVPVLPGGGHALLSFVDIRDAARAAVAAVEHKQPPSLVNVCDDTPAEFAAYAAAVARNRGLPRPLPAPAAAVRLVMPYTALILGGVRIPMSNRKAADELGWRPLSGPLDAPR